MIRAGTAVLAALLMLPTAPARAEVLDLSTMSCKQFVESGDDMIKLVLIWMDGWYKGDSDEAIIDTEVFAQNAKKFGSLLRGQPHRQHRQRGREDSRQIAPRPRRVARRPVPDTESDVIPRRWFRGINSLWLENACIAALWSLLRGASWSSVR